MAKSQLNPRTLFLVDAIGATISAIMLGYVLVAYQEYIGMPVKTLSFLAGIAKLFALYGFICVFITPKNWQQNLRWIAIANIMYCLLTLGIVAYHFTYITLLGIVYFLLEILAILFLVRMEFRFALKP